MGLIFFWGGEALCLPFQGIPKDGWGARRLFSLNLTLCEPSPDWAVFPVYGHRELYSLGLGFEGRFEVDPDWFPSHPRPLAVLFCKTAHFTRVRGFKDQVLKGYPPPPVTMVSMPGSVICLVIRDLNPGKTPLEADRILDASPTSRSPFSTAGMDL